MYIDNNGVLGSLIKGSSRSPETNLMVGRVWLHAASWSWAPFWVRVESGANLADGPTRRDLSAVRGLGATRVAPCLPEWMMSLWVAGG